MYVVIVVFVPRNSRKYSLWHDGFVAATKRLQTQLNVRVVNMADGPDLRAVSRDCDFLLAKSNWNWVVDRAVREQLSGTSMRKGILISGVRRPPPLDEMLFYDVLFYEMHWYRPQIAAHPHCVHAFGIDTTIMWPDPAATKRYDWLAVGQVAESKRQWKLLEKTGTRLLVGDLAQADRKILRRLLDGGVEVRDFVSYPELAALYNQARRVYIPARIDGGGERAVLEARSCGIPVEVEPDNPKLQKFVESPIWDHEYYADQLLSGIRDVLK